MIKWERKKREVERKREREEEGEEAGCLDVVLPTRAGVRKKKRGGGKKVIT